MPVPTVTYYQLTTPGSGDLSKFNDVGVTNSPRGTAISQLAPGDFGIVQAENWGVVPIVIGFAGTNNTITNMTFWLEDPAALLDQTQDVTIKSGESTDWGMKVRVSRLPLAANELTAAAIAASPWEDLGYGAEGSQYPLGDRIAALAGGGNNGTNALTVVGPSAVRFANAFLYIAAEPNAAAAAGDYTAWGARLNFVYT